MKSAVQFSDIYDDLLNPVEPVFLVDGLIEDRTTGAIIGATGAGKTFIAVSLAYSVATGTPWAGHKVNRKGPVIYIAGEGRSGVIRRVHAFQEYNNMPISPGQLFLSRSRISLDVIGAEKITRAVDELAGKHGAPVLLIIDTLARALPEMADENSNKDIMAFVNKADKLGERYGCVAIIIHHVGHNGEKRARGGSALKGSLDFEFFVDEKGLFECTKMKEAERHPPIPFEIVETGLSAVAVFGDPIEGGHEHRRLTDADLFGLETFYAVLKQSGRDQITMDEWRAVFYQMHKGKVAEQKRKPFERSCKALVKKKMLTLNRGLFALAGQPGQNETKS